MSEFEPESDESVRQAAADRLYQAYLLGGDRENKNAALKIWRQIGISGTIIKNMIDDAKDEVRKFMDERKNQQ